MGGGTAAQHSDTGGVKSMSISGQFEYVKERMAGKMTAEDRAWRKKWLQDQQLTPREPVFADIRNHPDLINPIRRFYRKPLDILFYRVMQPFIGTPAAQILRLYVGKSLMGLYGIFFAFYYFKYSTNNWERCGGWRVIKSRQAVLPGDPGYPAGQIKNKGADFADRDFKNSIFADKIKEECRVTPAPSTSMFGF